MSQNLYVRTRKKFATAKELAEELDVTVQQIYKILHRPEMETAIKRAGTACIRVDKEEFYRIMEQIYRKWKEID